MTGVLAGTDDPKKAGKAVRILKNRPELKADLAKKYPEIYGADAKLPAQESKKKKKKK